jgi:ubiquinone/menaquinone biosynthesis C-methylase UbiE
VLDVGAGSGVFLARFQQLASDWQCTAIEPNPDACEHLRTLPGIQVVGNFFAPDIFSERFELVTLNKVLEHVQDPVTFLSGVGEVLAPRGVVYVELPDKVTARCRPPTDNILGALHYHLYDPHTVTLLMRRAGVVPLSVQRYAEPSGKISVCGFGCTDALLLHIGGVA